MRYTVALIGLIWTTIGSIRFYNFAQDDWSSHARFGFKRSLASLLADHGGDMFWGLGVLIAGCLIALKWPRANKGGELP